MHSSRQLIYSTTLPIRWADLDEYGHVNHANYWVLFQEARLQWLNDVKLHQPFVYIFPIIEAHIEYRKALKYPGNVNVKLFAEKPDKKFWVLHHELYRDDNPTVLYASAWIRSVCADRQTQKIITLPDDFRKAFYPEKTH